MYNHLPHEFLQGIHIREILPYVDKDRHVDRRIITDTAYMLRRTSYKHKHKHRTPLPGKLQHVSHVVFLVFGFPGFPADGYVHM